MTTDTTRLRLAAEYLKDARVNAGMTQAELARQIGMSANALSVCESGKRALYPRYIDGACEVLGLDPDEIYALLKRVPPDLIAAMSDDLDALRLVRAALEKAGKL